MVDGHDLFPEQRSGRQVDFLDDIDPAPTADPFVGREDQDVLAVRLTSGERLEGSLMRMAGMTFLQVKDGTPNGKVHGPFGADEVAGFRVMRTREEIFAERHERSRGDPVPGHVVRTRDGYEARLDRLARAAAMETSTRRRQIENQFDDLADEIELARTKRNWVLAAARWARHSNEEPTKLDMSGGDMTSAEKFQRPRAQDFDPDQKVRRARIPVPQHIQADPVSTWNMIRVLRAHGYKARASVFGEVTFDAADLLVDFPEGKEKGRFSVTGSRGEDGAMRWDYLWDGNGTKADQTRRRRCFDRPEYQTFIRIVSYGTMMPSFVEKGPRTHRVDLLVDDPQPVFDWLRDHAGDALVRKLARETVVGWHFAAVFDDPAVAGSFRECWRNELYTKERVAEQKRNLTDHAPRATSP